MKYETVSIFTRTEDLKISTIAIILFITAKKMTELQIVAILIKYITEWLKTTQDGKEAWIQSCEDLNIGDLTLCEEEFRKWLKKKKSQDLIDLEILYCGETKGTINFDACLVDKSQLPENFAKE